MTNTSSTDKESKTIKMTLTTSLPFFYCWLETDFAFRSGVSIVDFEQLQTA